MSYYDQQQGPVAYPPPPTAYPPPPQSYPPPGTGYSSGPYVVPPPVGYPMKNGNEYPQQPSPPGKTMSRGDGFWKGCCAALCCCCLLESCF